MGILPTRGKATMENIPNEVDRSMFSCERYQFFLDAPFEISHKCCSVMKKEPFARYHKETGRVPITAQMASESRLRTQVWLKNGCNAFEATKQISNPMSFWTEQDVLLYIYQNKIKIASVYGEIAKENEVEGQLDFEDLGLFELERPTLKTTGCKRTGCVLCGYGAHREKAGEGRFEQLKKTHPNMYKALDKAKNSGVTMREAIDWTNEHGGLKIRY
jgi:3'-phosphoadenosine 5'-phosphosulfate sulfotransferase (PAPS reductase)/FAD synthetase